MFQAKGCPVYGCLDGNLGPHLEKLPKEKVIVFDSSKAGAQGCGEAVKLGLSTAAIKEGAEAILKSVKGQDEKTMIVFCGDSEQEVTAGMVMSCCVKSINTIRKMRAMIEDGITEKDWTLQLIRSTFEDVAADAKIENYDVVNTLAEKLGEPGRLGKILADKMIDICDVKVNLRKCIQDQKAKYDSSDENKELKLQTISSLENYFHIVCYCAYLRSEVESGSDKSFTDWIKEKTFIPDMVEHGIRIWRDMTFFSLSTRKSA